MNLLIVDDNPEILFLLSSALKKYGHKVDVASNGPDALSQQKTNGYDIIITRAEMQKIDGIGLCRQLRHEFPELTIIGITGSHALMELKEAGADVCLSKPFSIDVLDTVIKNRFRFTGYPEENSVLESM